MFLIVRYKDCFIIQSDTRYLQIHVIQADSCMFQFCLQHAKTTGAGFIEG